ncbi:MAG: EAL domain-containing protein [Desulfobulbaceae bacterium]|nr:EAL domain-containing protein [Desulfobulbaceae bacterium]
MRTWEVDNNRAIPSDLVREQDLIMRVRHMQRVGKPQLVVNLALSEIDASYGGRGPLEEAQQRLKDFAVMKRGTYTEMSNGDIFLIWPDGPSVATLPNLALNAALPKGAASDDIERFRLIYHLPADYGPLRERADYYVSAAQAATLAKNNSSAAQALQSETARGPLTAWSVNQIEKLFDEIDFNRYMRRQSIYQREKNGKWTPLFDEYFISFEELRRVHFPKLEIRAPEHLFLELCQALDRRLLTGLTENYEVVANQNLSLNFSVASVMGTELARFSHQVPRASRGKICFELHRGDLLQDFTLTLNAMMVLHREGFKVAIDDVTPDILGYLNLALFETDFIKLNVAKNYVTQLITPTARKALAQIPPEKLILYHCDNQPAIAAGMELGINKFQGWLIDDLVRGH